MEYLQQLSKNIKYYRKINNITQQTLKKELNVSQAIISKWEQGMSDPSSEKIKKLAQLFNITVDELINNNEENYKKSYFDKSFSNAKITENDNEIIITIKK